MLNVLLFFLVLVVVLMIALILVQKSDGGGLVSSSTTKSIFSVRGTTNFLSRTTAVLAGLFFVLSLLIAVWTKKEGKDIRDVLTVDKIKKSAGIKTNKMNEEEKETNKVKETNESKNLKTNDSKSKKGEKTNSNKQKELNEQEPTLEPACRNKIKF